ncbi:MAG: T9SS type A sorting domain-containing protein [Sphingobacteriales bacterium]|nr:MAG: T9SS type A sorting domain-containing protein [Sphingobacteriales bacterium]
MRTEFYLKLFAVLSLFLLPLAGNSQTTVSVYADGAPGSFNTGSVSVNGLKLDGNLDSISIGNPSPYFTQFRGWASFDLSTIPVGATITAATLYFTTYNGTTSSGAINNISGFVGSPSAMTGVNLFNAIGSGATINSSAWTASGLQTQPLNASGVTLLQTNLGSSVNVGFMRVGYLAYYIYGYPAPPASQPRLDITYTVSNLCSAVNSVTASGPAAVCNGTVINLSSAATPASANYTFQWESSPAGASAWANIAGATNSTLTLTQTDPTDYRVVVTCPTSSSSGVSNTVAVAQTNFNSCYCPATVSYTLNDDITNVALGSINNTTACASLTGTQGTAAGFPDIISDFTTSAVPVPSLMQGVSHQLSVTMNSCGAVSTTRECKAYIDYDQNGLFTDPGEEIVVYAHGNPNSTTHTATVNFTVPATANLGNTRMRVLLGQALGSITSPCSVLNSYGEAEDYTVEIVPTVACSGNPTAGPATGPALVCPGNTFNLSVSVPTVGTGITIQWESSPAGAGAWAALSGATTASYTVAGGITAQTDYRAVVSCVNGGGQDISNIVTVDMNPFYLCYCGPATGVQLNNFAINYLTNVNIPATTLNNTTTSTTGYTLYWPNTASTTASLVQGQQYTINTTHAFSGYYTGAWIDFDGNGMFDATEFISVTSTGTAGSVTFTVPLTATPGLTGMRLRHYYLQYTSGQACTPSLDYETEDYVVDIVATTACTGMPSPGTASGPAAICSAIPFNLNLTGYTIGLGISVQWESSPAGMNSWGAISGATNGFYTVPSQTSATDYRAVVTCSNGGGQDFSNVVPVAQNPANQCYCPPQYSTGCTSLDDINSFTLTGSNTTEFNDVNTGCVPGAYDDRTAQTPVDLFTGMTYNGTVNSNYPTNQNLRIWIDFGDDGVFDPADEVTPQNYAFGGAIPVTYAIDIPATAPLGTHRMRARDVYGNAVFDACSLFSFGEVHDYTVSILSNPLAIKLDNIRAVNVGSRNRLDWNTASEQSGDYFELERSTDGRIFSKISTVDARGQAYSYTYWDENPFTGANHYRLKMFDAAGSFTYSKVVQATLRSGGFVVEAFPNPVNQVLTVTIFGSQGENATISIMDLTGKLIKLEHVAGGKAEVNMNGIAPGTYLLKYVDSEHSQSLKINKQ